MLSRLVVLGLILLAGNYDSVFSDQILLWQAGNSIVVNGEVVANSEYPIGLRSLSLLAGLFSDPLPFILVWILTCLALDLALTLVLLRRARLSAMTWILAGAALGPVLLGRVELLVALLCVLALLHRESRPFTSGVLIGAAVLIKLWPLVLLAPLLPRNHSVRLASGTAATLLVGFSVSVAAFGMSSLWDPWRYQGDRGLQVESLAANAHMLLARLAGDPVVIESDFRSLQLVEEPPPWLDLAGLLAILVIGLATMSIVNRAGKENLAASRTVGAAALAVASVVCNTVFSPQYVLWFAPIVALAVAGPRHPRGVVATLIAISGLTQLVYPWLYSQLLSGDGSALAVLTARNLLTVALLCLLGLWLVRLTRPARPSLVSHGLRSAE